MNDKKFKESSFVASKELDQFDLKKTWTIVQKRWPLLLASIVLFFALGVIFTLGRPKLYRATASIVVSPEAPKVLTGVQGVSSGGRAFLEQSFLSTEEKVIKSRAVAQRTAELLNFRMDDVHNGLAKINDLEKREAARKSMKIEGMLLRKYTVEPQRRSRVFHIKGIDKDPKFAADIANAVATSYMTYNVDKRSEGTKDASSWLAVRHGELRERLAESEEKLHLFMKDKGILGASPESQLSEIRERLGNFSNKLTELQSALLTREMDRKALADLNEHPELLDTIPDLRSVAVVNDLKQQIVSLNAQLQDLSGRYLPAHPKIKALSEQKKSLTAELKREVAASIKMLERENAALAKTESGLKRVILEERQKEAKLNEFALEYARLNRDVETNSKLYGLVTTRIKELDLTGMLQVNNVSILDYAETPSLPYTPNWKRNLLISLILGIGFGCVVIFLLEFLDTSLKSQEDVEEYLQAPFLGVLPIIEAGDEKTKALSRLKDKEGTRLSDLYIFKHPKGMVAECSRAIRTNLHFMSPDKPLKTIMVTSALPREGKTTSSVNLAVTMAQAGGKVLLVDTDMRRPRVHRSFAIENSSGISSLILGESTFEEAIHHSEMPGLDVLPCGPVPPNPSELLHTKKFADVFEQLCSMYDKIIFDAPPVGAVTDPVILGTYVDGAILVAKTGGTPRDTVAQALRVLDDAHVNFLGLVLNDMEISTKKYGYYYGKYYRYGKYYQYGRYYGNYGEGDKTSSPA